MTRSDKKEVFQNILDMKLKEFKEFILNYCELDEDLDEIIDLDILEDDGVQEKDVVDLFSLTELALVAESIVITYSFPKKYLEIYKNLGDTGKLVDLDELEEIYEEKGEEELKRILTSLILIHSAKKQVEQMEKILNDQIEELLEE